MSVAAVSPPHVARWPLAVATVFAAAAGALLGVALAPDEPDTTRPAQATPRIGLASGVARLPLPDGWAPLGRLSTLPGFEAATAVRGVHAEAALDIRAPEHASLLPAGVATAIGDRLPDPQPRPLDARTAWQYDLGEVRPGTRVLALVLPTTRGVVTIACASPPGAFDRAAPECERAARAVRLEGASALTPTPETAAAIALPDAIARLNRVRRSERRRIAATQSPERRSAAVRRLARGYAATARALRPLAAGDALRLTATLGALARRHRALAIASRRRNARDGARAGTAIGRGEAQLAALLAALTGPADGAQPAARRAG